MEKLIHYLCLILRTFFGRLLIFATFSCSGCVKRQFVLCKFWRFWRIWRHSTQTQHASTNDWNFLVRSHTLRIVYRAAIGYLVSAETSPLFIYTSCTACRLACVVCRSLLLPSLSMLTCSTYISFGRCVCTLFVYKFIETEMWILFHVNK